MRAWMIGWIKARWVPGWRADEGLDEWLDECLDEWLDECLDGGLDERLDEGRMGAWMKAGLRAG